MIGATLFAKRSAFAFVPSTARRRTSARWGLPRTTPRAFAAFRASRVRCEISCRSFSASAAYRCSMKGFASAPRSATMNETLCAISPLMKCTSRERRSNLATITGHLRRRASARAAASLGRRSSASEPLPVSTSTYSATISRSSAAANLASTSRCASSPSHDLPWRAVLTRT